MLASPPRVVRGFTLVEVMVVLVIIGLVAGLALPNLQRLYFSVERRGQLEQVIADINTLGEAAFLKGAGFQLLANEGRLQRSDGKVIGLPLGWQASIPDPIIYLNSGACRGGNIVLRAGDEVLLSARLQVPHCQIRDE